MIDYPFEVLDESLCHYNRWHFRSNRRVAHLANHRGGDCSGEGSCVHRLNGSRGRALFLGLAANQT